MKNVKNCLHILLIVTVLLSVSRLSVGAEGKKSEELARDEADELLGEFSLILPDGMEELADGDGVSNALGFEAILEEVVSLLRGEMPSVLSFFLFLVGLSLLLCTAGLIGERTGGAMQPALMLVSGFALFARLMPLISDASNSFTALGEFFSLLIPLLTGAAALTGGAYIAGTSGVGMSVALAFFGGVCRLLLPLAAALTLLGIISSLAPDTVGGTHRAVNRVFMRGIGIVSTAIAAIFALQTTIASARDGAAIRAVKYAASGSIPVVGTTVSGALATLAGGLQYAVGIIGGGGVAAMLSLTLSPLFRLLLYKLAFFLAQLLFDLLPTDNGLSVLRSASQGLDAVIAVYTLGSVVYILCAVLVMQGIISVL